MSVLSGPLLSCLCHRLNRKVSHPRGTHKSCPFTRLSHKEPYVAISPTNPSLSTEGKAILITGGSEGIGYAIVAAFAAAGAANIVILSRRAELLQETKKNVTQEHPTTKVHTFPTSIDDAVKVKNIFTEVRAHTAEPDILVLCAARGHQPTPTLSIPIDSLWKDFEINVKENLNVVTEYLRPATLVKEKKIIDLSSRRAHQRIPCMASYGASKEAFMHILMRLQEEHAEKNVRIISYHLGAILTSLSKAYGFHTYWGNDE